MKNLTAFLLRLVSPRRRVPKEVSRLVIESHIPGRIEEGGLPASSPAGNERGSSADRGERCCVCLSELAEGDAIISSLPCSHLFHKVCIDRWLNLCQKTCPICRFLVQAETSSGKREEITEEMMIWFSSFHIAGF
uniref:RING-type E3 ubiquitin transferase n=1 Tax=Nelumbo nucifera TaxID=4432 RepID=A0A822Z5M0_NELNU|nr:TPA_asm: hypothetical protein HUJ06_016007 [Nelumbo nucifera]